MAKATRSARPKDTGLDPIEMVAPGAEEAGAGAAAVTPADPVAPMATAGPVTVHVGPQGSVTITVQPAAPAGIPPDAPLDDITAKAFGFPFGRKPPVETTATSTEPGPVDQFMQKLRAALDELGAKIADFAENVTSLEVRTFVSERIEEVQPKGPHGFEAAQQRAMTLIHFDGDTEVVVPVEAGQIDEALWKIHLQTVEVAQAHRAAMVKTIGELAQGFLSIVK